MTTTITEMTIYLIMIILTDGGPMVVRACLEPGKTEISSLLKNADIYISKATLSKEEADRIEDEMLEESRNNECLNYMCKMRMSPLDDDDFDGLPFH